MSYDMTEIEKRLALAAAYRKLLDQELLPSTEVNDLVVSEIKEFVHGRLELILGVRPAENPSLHFSGVEIVALKSLIRKILDSKDKANAAPVQEQRTSPVIEKPKPHKPKSTRKKSASVKAPVQEQSQKTSEPVSSAKPVEQSSAPLPANVVVENGRTYEYVDVGGKKFAKDITKQARSSTAKPMPSKAQFESMLYTNAMQELAMTANSNPIVGAAVQATINKG